MAGIHRSSTLGRPKKQHDAIARDGRDSPLKYTVGRRKNMKHKARDGRDSPLKYTMDKKGIGYNEARDGRDSPLKYTRMPYERLC